MVSDSNLNIRHDTDSITILALYVDDILLTGSSLDQILVTKQVLESVLGMSDLSDGSFALYLKAEILQVLTGIFIIQRGYCQGILKFFRLDGLHHVSTPIIERLRLSLDLHEAEVDPTLYRCIVGKLIQLTHTRVDIAYALSIVGRYMAVSHLQAVKRIFRYLASTHSYEMLFGRGQMQVITGWSDSDYAGDRETRQTIGFVFQFGTSPITWFSKKQPTVALSSTKAEYRAISEAARETVWLRILMNNLGLTVTEPIFICCDNKSSIRLVRNPIFHSKTKHIYMFIITSQERNLMQEREV